MRPLKGPNIGLINYLATYARINEYGFIEAPYRKVDHATGRVTDEVVYMTADVEDQYIVAQAAEPTDEEGRFINERITCRHRDEIIGVERERVDFVDISPRMMVSIATAMIPFLPNDDANRALMGANMQRQAVPLLRPEAPIVGTGMEHKICLDSEIVVLAEGDGVVTKVDATARHRPLRQRGDQGVQAHQVPPLQPHHLHQPAAHRVRGRAGPRPAAEREGRVERTPPSWPTAPATDQGEIALGRNILWAS